MEENFDLAPPELIERQDAAAFAEAKEQVSDTPGDEVAAPGEAEPEVPANQAETEDSEDSEGSYIDAAEDDQVDADDAEDLEVDADNNEDVEEEEVPHRIRKPAKPDIMERFAAANGFSDDGAGRYRHVDGSTLRRTDDMWPWERRSANGGIRYYWAKDHCLEHKPLELGAQIWNLMDTRPDQYALILCDMGGEPIEVTGRVLQTMARDGKLRLFPASYRVVFSPK
jgi:hypothetical protein